jgi:hypothetical protein
MAPLDAASNTAVVDERGAATILGISPATLRNQRSQGRGPKYYRIGRRIVYGVHLVLAYRDARTVDPAASR